MQLQIRTRAMKLKVNEVFYSLQGEGARAGCPSIFVRLTGCDLACAFCDTEFESGQEMTVDELVAKIDEAIEANGAQREDKMWIVWTGGEPTLQLTSEHVAKFKQLGFMQAIETNGNHPVPEGLDWVACSPKVAEHVVVRNHPNGVDELRYVRHAGQPACPAPLVKAKRYFISPRFDGDRRNQANLNHCNHLS